MGRESRRNRSRLADSARLGDDEAGDQIRILTRHVAIVIVEGEIEGMQNPPRRLACCEPAYKTISRLGAFIAKQAILRPVRDNHIEIWPDSVNSAQFIQHDSLGVIEDGGSNEFSVLIVGMHIIFVWVSARLTTVKGNKEHRHRSWAEAS
jgi:hypothetical protein